MSLVLSDGAHSYQNLGIFLVTFLDCLRVLFLIDGRFKPFGRIHIKMVFAALAMFVFASLDVAFHLRHNLDAFVSSSIDPVKEFSQTSSWINVMSMGCYVAQTFIGDSILVSRVDTLVLRVVTDECRRSTDVGLSGVGAVCGVLTVYTEATLSNNKALLNAHKIIPFITSMLSFTLITNLLTTCEFFPFATSLLTKDSTRSFPSDGPIALMVYRIQKIRQRLKHKPNSTTYTPLTNVMRLLIESGLLYTSSIVILFILYIISNNGQYGVSDAVRDSFPYVDSGCSLVSRWFKSL
ncbi:hypothetical protein AN958_00561 [Leucoagaricus sp. SymC.cos]|nr:hypothetical protein AN958_00561 [Leucoagaricus sp. SymC.cos]